MTEVKTPEFPLTVVYSNGEREVFDDEEHLVLNLEWFDSDPSGGGEERLLVIDRLGRRVRLRIDKFEITWCELRD